MIYRDTKLQSKVLTFFSSLGMQVTMENRHWTMTKPKLDNGKPTLDNGKRTLDNDMGQQLGQQHGTMIK